MADLAPLKYGRVVGRFLANIADGPDLGDSPEFVPLAGQLTFTAGAPRILVATAEPDPATYVQLPEYYVCQLDEFGYITWRGGRGIRLVAPGPETNPAEWTWRVSFDLSYEGKPVPIAPFNFVVPEYVPGPDEEHPDEGSSGLVDLTLASPVPASEGSAVVRGERGEGIQVDRRVATYGALPGTPPEGDGAQYVVAADGLLYVYRTGDGWMPDGQGIVIRGPSGTTTWAGITDKPSTFTPSAHGHVAVDIVDSSAVGRAVLTATDAPAARTALGAVGTSRQITTGTGLTGGGDLSTDLTLAVAYGTSNTTAARGDDARLSDARTPTAAGQVYDITYTAQSGTRTAGAGNVLPHGIKLRRNVRLTEVTYRGETAGASGNLVVELRKNGSAVSGTSKSMAIADQTAGGVNATATGTWDYDAGDVLLPFVTGLDTSPGRGLVVDIKGVTR